MKRGKRVDGKVKPVRARKKATAQLSTPEMHTRPKTYELLVIHGDEEGEAGMVRMTSREVFEANCPGESPEFYGDMEEADISDAMRDRAERLASIEEKWHPDDLDTIAAACTDYVIEFRDMKELDTTKVNQVKMPATPIRHGK